MTKPKVADPELGFIENGRRLVPIWAAAARLNADGDEMMGLIREGRFG